MHRLLKRQLKKSGIAATEQTTEKQLEILFALIDESYNDADDDRKLLENSLEVSSKEMQELYEKQNKSAQKKVRKSEAKYSRLIENLKHHYFFYTHDTNGVFNYLSDSITEMLGYTKEEFLNHYETYLTDDPMNVLVEEKTDKALAGEAQEPYTVSTYHKDGSVRILEVMEQPVFDKSGKVVEIEGIARDITDIIETQKELNYLAQHDSLTGISNRMNLYTQMEHIIASSKREQSKFAVLFLDLDHFKNINDTLGHNIGDMLLQQVVTRIKPNIRDEDLFSRLGGDEFVVVLTRVSENHLTNVIHKIMELLREEYHVDDHTLKITSSVGIALYPDDGSDTTTLMKNADIAMYKAKKTGRDNFSFFTDALNAEIQNEMRMEMDMSKALENNEFIFHFQPKVETKSNRIIGAEALIRWNHPEDGMIYPDQFIPLAESNGFIIKLGRWVIEEGCRAIAEFNRAGRGDLHLSINLSTYQIQNDDIAGVIKEAILINKIAAGQLFVEITESVMLKRTEMTIEVLEKIKAMGVNICLDDFGTGYSSLSYLHQYPVDSIKIDKSFVHLIEKDGSKAVLLDTIIAMGETLDLKIIAEGVEEEYQLEYLIQKQCSYYQGYLFSKPLEKQRYMDLF